MKSLIVGLTLLLSAATGTAEEVLREIAWERLPEDGLIRGGTVLPPDDGTAFARLKLENPRGERVTVTVLTLERPPITSPRYAVRGMVRYDGVHGTGYLEMWSAFPGGGRYFSRTLAAGGPLKSLEGTSDWRPFLLPFFNETGAPPPTTLTVNVALPGPGTVYLGPLRLVQYRPGEDPLATPGQWWADRTAGLVGGLSGAIIGCVGALIGWLSSKGKARGFVLSLMKLLTGLGAGAILAGALAWLQGQPYAVWYPLLLTGLLSAAICGGLLGPTRRRYEAMELRKIRAADVR